MVRDEICRRSCSDVRQPSCVSASTTRFHSTSQSDYARRFRSLCPSGLGHKGETCWYSFNKLHINKISRPCTSLFRRVARGGAVLQRIVLEDSHRTRLWILFRNALDWQQRQHETLSRPLRAKHHTAEHGRQRKLSTPSVILQRPTRHVLVVHFHLLHRESGWRVCGRELVWFQCGGWFVYTRATWVWFATKECSEVECQNNILGNTNDAHE